MKEGIGKNVIVGLVSLITVTSSIGMCMLGILGIGGRDAAPSDKEEACADPLLPSPSQDAADDAGLAPRPDYMGLPGVDWPIGPTLSPAPADASGPTKATLMDVQEGQIPATASPPVDGPVDTAMPPDAALIEGMTEDQEPTDAGVTDTENAITDPPEDQVPPTEPAGYPPINKVPPTVLKALSELEGTTDFSRTDDPFYYSGGYGEGQGQGQGNGESAPGSVERTIEESDIVKLLGDKLYVLNPYRGLIVVDMEDPDAPSVVGCAPVFGTPHEMYVVGTRAYIIVTCTYGYWYWFGQNNMWWDWYYPRYQIGSRLVVVDIADPTDPRILIEYPIEGFVSDSRRVGDVLYYVANCYKWYNQYTGTAMTDLTYVLSVDIADPLGASMVDTVSFEGLSYKIHVTTTHLYVTHWESQREKRWGITNITLVDISDPRGSIEVTDYFTFDGYVGNKYQMDEYDGAFRVVSHYFFTGVGSSELFTFDVSDSSDVRPLGRLLIDDAGNLMATRFAGDRAYTIHLPRSVDPLDVIDLSDPANPVMCDVFEMPGWVTYMEVLGYDIISLGVDDSEGRRDIALSLFDVTDPWNVVMDDRVRFGGKYGYSTANWDPKALTVLDDQGLVLVPYSAYETLPNGYGYYRYGVQIVSFDLKARDLELRGTFDQPDDIQRTRGLGHHVMSTSFRYLVVADVTDMDSPVVTAQFDLCPNVVDYRPGDGQYMEIVMAPYGYGYGNYDLLLRVFDDGCIDLNPADSEFDLGAAVERWFWWEGFLHVLSSTFTEDDDWFLTLTSFPLWDPITESPVSTVFKAGSYTDHYSIYSWAWSCRGWWNMGYGYYSHRSPSIDNPVLLGNGVLVLYVNDTLFLADLRTCSVLFLTAPVVMSYECQGNGGLLPAGEDVFIVTSNSHYQRLGDGRTDYIQSTFLTRIELDGSMVESIGTAVQIPGHPLGTSSDGSRVYTTCVWYLPPPTGDIRTLNIVELDGEEAILLGAFNMEGKSFLVSGDTAVITEVLPNGDLIPLGENPLERSTMVCAVDLVKMEVRTGYLLPEVYTLRHASNGIAMLMSPDGLDIVLVSLEADGRAPVRSSMLQYWGYGLVCQGDRVYIVQGSLGVQVIDMGG